MKLTLRAPIYVHSIQHDLKNARQNDLLKVKESVNHLEFTTEDKNAQLLIDALTIACASTDEDKEILKVVSTVLGITLKPATPTGLHLSRDPNRLNTSNSDSDLKNLSRDFRLK